MPVAVGVVGAAADSQVVPAMAMLPMSPSNTGTPSSDSARWRSTRSAVASAVVAVVASDSETVAVRVPDASPPGTATPATAAPTPTLPPETSTVVPSTVSVAIDALAAGAPAAHVASDVSAVADTTGSP